MQYQTGVCARGQCDKDGLLLYVQGGGRGDAVECEGLKTHASRAGVGWLPKGVVVEGGGDAAGCRGARR